MAGVLAWTLIFWIVMAAIEFGLMQGLELVRDDVGIGPEFGRVAVGRYARLDSDLPARDRRAEVEARDARLGRGRASGEKQRAEHDSD